MALGIWCLYVLRREENFSPMPCRMFFHAMRLKGCKSFSRK